MQSTLTRRCFVEFVATFALILVIGFAIVREVSALYIVAITLVVLIGFYGHISGCHINPAVTLGLAANKKFSWLDVVPYWLSQILGAIFAILCLEKTLDPNISTKFCELFPTSAASEIDSSQSLVNLMMSQTFYLGALGTYLFVGLLLNIVTSKLIPPMLKGVGIALSLIAVSTLFGSSIFLSVNPAKTLSPILFQLKNESNTIPYLRDGLMIALASLIGGGLAGIIHSMTHKEELSDF